MKDKISRFLDRLIGFVPAMIIIAIYVAMIFIITDFEISMLLLIGGLLIGMIMGAMDISFFPLRPIIIMYTLAAIGSFIYITYNGASKNFSPEDVIVVTFFVVTILMMVLISMTKEETPSSYIIKVIIDWYGVILLFVFLFTLYYFECNALIGGGIGDEVNLQTSAYFSCITFTGLGYGDIVARPEFRMVAAMQSIIGYICMGGVAATIYSLIQSKLQAIHKAKRLEEKEENGENAST
jgi:Ion channel